MLFSIQIQIKKVLLFSSFGKILVLANAENSNLKSIED